MISYLYTRARTVSFHHIGQRPIHQFQEVCLKRATGPGACVSLYRASLGCHKNAGWLEKFLRPSPEVLRRIIRRRRCCRCSTNWSSAKKKPKRFNKPMMIGVDGDGCNQYSVSKRELIAVLELSGRLIVGMFRCIREGHRLPCIFICCVLDLVASKNVGPSLF